MRKVLTYCQFICTIALQIFIIVLKIFGVIRFPWLWVLAPLWIFVGICALSLLGVFVYISITEKRKKKQNREE